MSAGIWIGCNGVVADIGGNNTGRLIDEFVVAGHLKDGYPQSWILEETVQYSPIPIFGHCP